MKLVTSVYDVRELRSTIRRISYAYTPDGGKDTGDILSHDTKRLSTLSGH